jgi:hypothetical protein
MALVAFAHTGGADNDLSKMCGEGHRVPMNDKSKRRDLACGEAESMIRWGSDIEKVLELLRDNYGIEGQAADAIIADAVRSRMRAVRKKALLALGFAVIGLAISFTYFAIQGFVGFIVIGFGPICMGFLGSPVCPWLDEVLIGFSQVDWQAPHEFRLEKGVTVSVSLCRTE